MSNYHPQIPHVNPTEYRRKLVKVSIVIGVVGLALAGIGIMQRSNATAELAKVAAQSAIPTVSVINAALSDNANALVLPGNLEPLNSASIYAQTNGYIKEWLVDIGDTVKKGQVLAILDAPELLHQLAQAKADYATALAEQNNAQSMADRANSLMKMNSAAISREMVEQRSRDAEAKTAATAAARANVNRLESLQSFTRLTAPFDGKVTSRSAQLGELVVAGNSNAQPLFTISDTRLMRVFVRVPQNYAAQMQTDQQAELVLPEYNDKTFPAAVTRSAHAVDVASGSVLVELQANNEQGELMPGAYAQVSFKLASNKDRIRVPGSAILYRDQKPSVATINDKNIVALKPVKIGRDEGTTVELLAGINATDRIITTPPDAVRSGDEVRVAK
ncbi:MAG: efflux RND transporter periplasmic adaptor subunit [Cellvibrio sp.]|uniref:efflux RND transporter periplasmic adaptor subunit n=1 Tax=Cellvibrio sp. TaxID=1965322 RepID=UPI0031A229EC